MSVATDSPKAESDEISAKRYLCSYPGCNQKLESEAALAVHKQKHQMTLTLGPSKMTSLADVLPVDQTPTPTRFLHMGNQLGLFDELNPFDREFKTAQKDGLTSKQRRAAVVAQQLQALNNKRSPSTPTRSLPGSSIPDGIPMAAQPVQVIALTPTLPSPVAALPGAASPFLVPPLLPSPQALHIPPLPGYTATSPMQVPANLLSPTLMPFPTGLIPGVQASLMADAQQRAAAFTQAMFAAAASAASTQSTQVSDAVSSSQTVQNNAVTSSAAINTNMAEKIIHPNENLKIPSIVLPKQERPMSVSSTTSDTNSSFPEMPNSLETHQLNLQQAEQYHHGSTENLSQYPVAVHQQGQTTVDTHPSSYMANAQQVQTGSNQHQVVAANAMTHPALTHRGSGEFGSNPNLLDAKQKLKETLTSNKPNLHQSFDHSVHQNSALPNSTSVPLDSAVEQKPAGRRRGRQSQDIDPDVKRQRFLERNRAAASRCRNKKKLWVNGLESKAKNLSQTNVMLQNEIAALKDEIATLKQLLLSHRDCPIMKMQQQSMSLAGINLDLTSSVTLSAAAVKSESASNPDSLHPPLASTLSNSSIAERNVPSQQPVSTSVLSNGSMFPTLSSTAASS